MNPDAIFSVVVQFPIGGINEGIGLGSSDDLDRRHYIELLLEQQLRATAQGHVDGGDIGGGTMNIFIEDVKDKYAVQRLIIETLEAHNLIVDGLNIAACQSDANEPYRLTHGGTGDFMLFGTPDERPIA